MKFFLILTNAMILFSSVLSAQTKKGSFALGGGLSYNFNANGNTGEIYKYSQVEFTPHGGYFISDNLEIGLQLGLSTGRSGIEGTDPTKSSSISGGPYARYYKFTSNDRVAFIAETGFSAGSGKINPPGGNDVKTGTMSFYLSPGFTYFLTNKLGLDFQLQGIVFNSVDPNKDVDNDTNTSLAFGTNSFNPSFGFRYYISR